MRGQVSLSATLILIPLLVFSSAGAAQAQLMPASRHAINLTARSVAGTTAISAHLSYRLSNNWDLLLGSDTTAPFTPPGSLLSLGARYYLPSPLPNDSSTYLAVEVFSTGSGAASILVGVGELRISGPLTTFVTGGLGGSTVGIDLGIQYQLSPQFSLVIGKSFGFAVDTGFIGDYFGLSIGLPEP